MSYRKISGGGGKGGCLVTYRHVCLRHVLVAHIVDGGILPRLDDVRQFVTTDFLVHVPALLLGEG